MNDVPILKENPELEQFVRNMVDTNPRIQLPAIQHAVVITFNRDGIGESEVDDEKFCRFISGLLAEKAPPAHDTAGMNLGKGVGTTFDLVGEKDSNKDPWLLLTPQKGF